MCCLMIFSTMKYYCIHRHHIARNTYRTILLLSSLYFLILVTQYLLSSLVILVDNIDNNYTAILRSCVPKTERKLSVKFTSLPPGGPET